MEKTITIQDINKLLKIDGDTVKAIDSIQNISPDLAIKMITFIIGKLS